MFSKTKLSLLFLMLLSFPSLAQDFSNVEGNLSCGVIGTTEIDENNFNIDLQDRRSLNFNMRGVSTALDDIEKFSQDLNWSFDFKGHSVNILTNLTINSRNRLNRDQQVYVTRAAGLTTTVTVAGKTWKTSTEPASFKGMELYPEQLWATVTGLTHHVEVSNDEKLIITCAMFYKNPNYSEE